MSAQTSSDKELVSNKNMPGMLNQTQQPQHAPQHQHQLQQQQQQRPQPAQAVNNTYDSHYSSYPPSGAGYQQQRQTGGPGYYPYGAQASSSSYGYPNASQQQQFHQSSGGDVTSSSSSSYPYQGQMPNASDYTSQSSLPPINSSTGSIPLANTAQQSGSAEQRPQGDNNTKFSATFWEDENTICYQVEAHGVPVSRREDSDFVNGTKLLNVVGMTRGRRDGILKSEKTRYVVKIGAMNLKGVWIPFDRAVELATSEGVFDLLYPLFVKDIKTYYHENIASNVQDSPYEKAAKPRKKRTLKKKKDEQEGTSQQYQNYQQYPQNAQYNPYYQQQPPQQAQYGGYYSPYTQQSAAADQTAYQNQAQPSQQYNPAYGRGQQQPAAQQQQPYAPYQSLAPQQQEYVQQYYNYYRQFQPQQQQAQQQQQANGLPSHLGPEQQQQQQQQQQAPQQQYPQGK